MNGPTIVLLVCAACWPVWSLARARVAGHLVRGSFTYEVTDDDGNVLDQGEADTYSRAFELAEVAASRLRVVE